MKGGGWPARGDNRTSPGGGTKAAEKAKRQSLPSRSGFRKPNATWNAESRTSSISAPSSKRWNGVGTTQKQLRCSSGDLRAPRPNTLPNGVACSRNSPTTPKQSHRRGLALDNVEQSITEFADQAGRGFRAISRPRAVSTPYLITACFSSVSESGPATIAFPQLSSVAPSWPSQVRGRIA